MPTVLSTVEKSFRPAQFSAVDEPFWSADCESQLSANDPTDHSAELQADSATDPPAHWLPDIQSDSKVIVSAHKFAFSAAQRAAFEPTKCTAVGVSHLPAHEPAFQQSVHAAFVFANPATVNAAK